MADVSRNMKSLMLSEFSPFHFFRSSSPWTDVTARWSSRSTLLPTRAIGTSSPAFLLAWIWSLKDCISAKLSGLVMLYTRTKPCHQHPR